MGDLMDMTQYEDRIYLFTSPRLCPLSFMFLHLCFDELISLHDLSEFKCLVDFGGRSSEKAFYFSV